MTIHQNSHREVRILMIVLFASSLFALSACHAREVGAADLQKLIQQSLKPGDSGAEIVRFFEEHKLPYDFDLVNQRYESVVPASQQRNIIGVKSAISIYIYVNKDRSFQRAEVEKFYTYI
jgi:hypothetical protein